MYVGYDRWPEGPSESPKRRVIYPSVSPHATCVESTQSWLLVAWHDGYAGSLFDLLFSRLPSSAAMGPHAISRWMAMSKQTARLQASWSSVWFPYGLTGYLLCQTHLLLRHAVACDHRFGTTFKLVESTETLPTSILVPSPSPHLTL